MKVLILNTSDIKGGAAIVSYRLMKALTDCGVDARMLVADRHGNDPLVECATRSRNCYKSSFYRERLDIFLHNGLSRKNLFKVSTAATGINALSHPWVKEADVVCLNWINQGFLSLSDIQRLGKMGKKIVWTMHDMWCCTGICHHAYECTHFRQSCGNCLYLGRMSGSNDLSHRIWLRKKKLYDSTPIEFVAVSHWLAEKCNESGLLANRKIHVINNPMPVENFDYHRIGSKEETVIGMGAARLDDPVKGFELLIEATNKIVERHPEDAHRLKLLLFGSIRDQGLLDRLKMPTKWIGPVAMTAVPDIYRQCDIVLSSSHFETLPTTLIEGQAAGCLAVAFDHGGQKDIIDHRQNGYLAHYPDTDDLANGLEWAINESNAADRRQLHLGVEQRFSAPSIAKAYLQLFTGR